MRIYSLFASAVAVSLLALVVPTTASAVTDVEVTASDVTVRYGGCEASLVRVTGDWPKDETNEIHIVVQTPAGRVYDEMTVRDDSDGVVSRRVEFCEGQRAGVYRVQATVVGYDKSDTVISRVRKWTSITYTFIPKKSSSIRHRVIHKPSRPVYKYVVPGQLVRQGHGLKRQRVLLLAWILGDWYEIDAGRTGRRGLFGWEFKPNNFEWCYYYGGNNSTKAAASRVFSTGGRSARGAKTVRPTLAQVRALVKGP